MRVSHRERDAEGLPERLTSRAVAARRSRRLRRRRSVDRGLAVGLDHDAFARTLFRRSTASSISASGMCSHAVPMSGPWPSPVPPSNTMRLSKCAAFLSPPTVRHLGLRTRSWDILRADAVAGTQPGRSTPSGCSTGASPTSSFRELERMPPSEHETRRQTRPPASPRSAAMMTSRRSERRGYQCRRARKFRGVRRAPSTFGDGSSAASARRKLTLIVANQLAEVLTVLP